LNVWSGNAGLHALAANVPSAEAVPDKDREKCIAFILRF
jgi:hypothetical protein